MKRSTDRILTTHVGSLARPRQLLETMREKEHGRPYDRDLFERQVRDAVAEVVRKQAEVGLDVVSDGEQGKVSFLTYVNERLSGFELEPGERAVMPSWQRELEMFPEYYQEYFKKYSAAVSPMPVMVCRGPVRYTGQEAVQRDIANLKAALEQVQVEEAFMPATCPRGFGRNEYYPTDEEFVYAVAEALREEYLAIVEAGLVLQIDDPWLIEVMSEDPATTKAERRARAQQHVEVVNHALRGIPPERVRFHTCYGLNHGPRLHDVPLAEVMDLILAVNAGAYSFEVANPRHQHEWRIWETMRLPEGKLLIPGFISHATNFVEHPRLIADGILTYARLVGRENVIAGADCGFSSRATFAPEVHPTVAWAKFQALVEGARIASRELW
ncbi:MAG TPA: cobalamin-independent methionine synthase II family protein [Candidatus Dormibacteraeota bacterium]|nr:cobalamin-independent methionine synthase II family protein [Candidatus Dormibacteraeota bacterium]